MSLVDGLYDDVCKDLLNTLRVEWQRYGWENSEIDDKLDKLNALWSERIDKISTTNGITSSQLHTYAKYKKNKRKRDDEAEYLRQAPAQRQSVSSPSTQSSSSSPTVHMTANPTPHMVKSEPSTVKAEQSAIKGETSGEPVKLEIPSQSDSDASALSQILEDLQNEPLNVADDDIEDQELTTVIDQCSNLLVCQYDTVQLSKLRWKVKLREGIMNINGKDYWFGKCEGDLY